MEPFSWILIPIVLIEQGIITYILLSIFSISIKNNIYSFIKIVLSLSVLVINIRFLPVSPVINLVLVFVFFNFTLKYIFIK